MKLMVPLACDALRVPEDRFQKSFQHLEEAQEGMRHCRVGIRADKRWVLLCQSILCRSQQLSNRSL
jgi:hypothetical protein